MIRSGVVEGIHLERDWTAHPPQQLWRRTIGLDWSAFAVAGRSAITHEQRAKTNWWLIQQPGKRFAPDPEQI